MTDYVRRWYVLKPETRIRYLDALMRTHKLLISPNRWTKEAMARDDKGRAVSPWSERATCWCLQGAVDKEFVPGSLIARDAYPFIIFDAMFFIIEREHPELSGTSIGNFNDYHANHQMILNVIQKTTEHLADRLEDDTGQKYVPSF